MRYRNIAGGELLVSEIGFGTGDNAGLMVHGSRQQQINLVAHALEAGVNVFDTAPDYGRGSAEVNLGQVLRELKADDAVVVTKVDIFPEDVERIAESIRISIVDSLTRLRRETIDVIMLHNPCWRARDASRRYWTILSPEDVLDEVLPEFVRARESGKVRFFGLNCDNATQVAAVRPLLESGHISLINAVYHVANSSAARKPAAQTCVGNLNGLFDDYSGLFDLAVSNGAAANIIKPLAGGALTRAVATNGRAGLHELSHGWFRNAPQSSEPAIREARRFLFLDRDDQTLSEAAFRFSLDHPAVASVVGGFGERAHIDEAVRASSNGPLRSADLARISELQRELTT